MIRSTKIGDQKLREQFATLEDVAHADIVKWMNWKREAELRGKWKWKGHASLKRPPPLRKVVVARPPLPSAAAEQPKPGTVVTVAGNAKKGTCAWVYVVTYYY